MIQIDCVRNGIKVKLLIPNFTMAVMHEDLGAIEMSLPCGNVVSFSYKSDGTMTTYLMSKEDFDELWEMLSDDEYEGDEEDSDEDYNWSDDE